jgi:DNA-binding MarR family transcriptional regulator
MARYDRDPIPELPRGPIPPPPPHDVVHDFSVAFPPSGQAAREDSPHRLNGERFRNRERGLEHEARRSEFGVLRDIGTFRSLALEDLTRYRYYGDSIAAKHDLGSLLRSGLIQRRTSYPERSIYITLTRHGHRLLVGSEHKGVTVQRFYHGFVKNREAKHDTALYRLYHQEIERIAKAGGRVRRVVLDYELKRSINRRLAALASLPKSQQERERQEVAEIHGLKVVSGKILLPDLRLEYESPDGEMAKVDLELVTHHYHHDNLLAKAKAGFAMYALPRTL